MNMEMSPRIPSKASGFGRHDIAFGFRGRRTKPKLVLILFPAPPRLFTTRCGPKPCSISVLYAPRPQLLRVRVIYNPDPASPAGRRRRAYRRSGRISLLRACVLEKTPYTPPSASRRSTPLKEREFSFSYNTRFNFQFGALLPVAGYY